MLRDGLFVLCKSTCVGCTVEVCRQSVGISNQADDGNK